MSQLLAQHPYPRKSRGHGGYVESQRGYLLRLGEVNGYATPYSILNLAGLGGKPTRPIGSHLGRLIEICNFSSEILMPLRHIDDVQRTWRLLEHIVPPWSLRNRELPICTQCVQEKEFIEGHWDLRFMTGCPEHRVVALMGCPVCSKPLGLFRRGLLRCSCGAELVSEVSRRLNDQEADLLDIIRRKVLRLPPVSDYASAIPGRELSKVDLDSILRLVRSLGWYWLDATAKRGREDEAADTVAAAAHVLSSWPDNFHNLMDLILENGGHSGGGFTRSCLQSLHVSLIKTWERRCGQDGQFIRTAFTEYALKRWRFYPIATFSRKDVCTMKDDRYCSSRELGKHLGIDARTARRIIESGTVPTIEVQAGRYTRILADTESLALSPLATGRIYSLRKASQKIGVPIALMARLKVNGIYRCDHMPMTNPGYHELDIKAFIKALVSKAAAQPSCEDAGELMTFRQALQRIKLSSELQIRFIRAILADKFPVFQGTSEGIHSLTILEKDLQNFAEIELTSVYGSSETFKITAKSLGCQTQAVAVLVKKRMLKVVRVGGYTRITADSIRAFQGEYISLAELANREETSSRALMDCCKRNSIQLLMLRLCRHAFIPRCYSRQLMQCFRERNNCRTPPELEATSP
jgi:hypothetical protein